MNTFTADFSELVGTKLAEAVDRLYAKHAEFEIRNLVEFWGPESPKVAYLLPFVARPFWASFGPLRPRPLICRREDDPLQQTYAISRGMYERLFEDRLEWFEKATAPLLPALARSLICVTGIQERAETSSWERTLIPQGLFEVGRWELQREGSRLIVLNSIGAPTEISYVACRLAAPAGSPTSTDKHEKDTTPLSVNEKTGKAGFVGRPSMREWMFEELEKRASQGKLADLLKIECEEIRALLKEHHPGEPSYPTPKVIANNIRHRYNELKGTK